jgi:hypothetical protein
MIRRARGLSTGLALALWVASSAHGASTPPLAGCYERIYDAAHLARHRGQLVVRTRLEVEAGHFPNAAGDAHPMIASAKLAVWVRGKKLSFDSFGACWAKDDGLACNASLSASETDSCKTKADGVRDCRIDWPDAAGSFRLAPKADGILLTIPERIELSETGSDAGPPFLYLSPGNKENHAFILKAAAASICD